MEAGRVSQTDYVYFAAVSRSNTVIELGRN